MCGSCGLSKFVGIFSKGSRREEISFIPGGAENLTRQDCRWSVGRPSRAIGLLFSCWFWRVISCQGQGSSLDPDLFPTEATGPATWDIPDDLGPHGQFARSIPSRWALTAGLLATKSLDCSSGPQNPPRTSRFSARTTSFLLLVFPAASRVILWFTGHRWKFQGTRVMNNE